MYQCPSPGHTNDRMAATDGERRAGVDSPLVAGVKVAGSVATASRPPDSDMPVTFGLDPHPTGTIG
jgi:hypothetical protein